LLFFYYTCTELFILLENILEQRGDIKMFSNRRRYIPSQQPEATIETISRSRSTEIQEHSQSNIPESIIKAISELKQSIRELDEKSERLDSKQRKLEICIDSCLSKSGESETNLSDLKRELEYLKRNSENAGIGYKSNSYSNKPIMPGLGFASVTSEYLKNLQQNK
jgi:hypothetical protein